VVKAYKLRLTVIVLDPNQGKSVEKVNPASIPWMQLAIHHLQIAEEPFCKFRESVINCRELRG